MQPDVECRQDVVSNEHCTWQLGRSWYDYERVGEGRLANFHIDGSYADGGQGACNSTNYHVGRVHSGVEFEVL